MAVTAIRLGLALALMAAPLAPAKAAAWPAAEVEATLAFGFAAIAERHLQPVSAQTLAIDGMRALAEIDPQVALAVKGDRLRVSTADQQVGDYALPAPGDASAWARLTVEVGTALSGPSAAIRDANAEALYQAIFEGALGKADLFSRYAGAAEATEHRAGRNGFGGIGIKFDMEAGEPRIAEVMEETPAFRAGLAVGDIIVSVGGQPVKGLDRNDISGRLRGDVGAELSLVVRRGGDLLPVSLRRSLIVPRTVTMTINGSVAQFKITSFNQRTAHTLEAQLRDARDRLGAGLQGVILDLRGNPGGLLDKAAQVADLFMAQGPIVSTKGRHPDAANLFEARPGDIGEDLALVVLVDGRSASAAEIVASALQDAGRAVVIGTNSYGKGTVQTVVTLPNKGEITLTWSRFHTPSGYALHGLGVLPNLCTAAGAPTPAGIIDAMMKGGGSTAKIPETLAVWRHAGFDEIGLRHRLRDICPPQRRTDAKSDMELAEKLLANRAAFARALSLSATPRSAEALQARAPQDLE
jgi:carboxyl-terminal processing protease